MEIFYGGLQVFMEVMSFSLRPVPRWFQTTQNSSFVEAEGRPNGGCRALKENESRPLVDLKGFEPLPYRL